MIHKNSSKIVLEELGKDCKRCGHCCSFGSGIVLESEIPKLSGFMKMDVEEFKKKYLEPHECFSTMHFRFKQNREKGKPYGSCIFLTKDKLCHIHDVKPLYCRIGNCGPLSNDAIQWFHLNHSIDKFRPDSIREWKIYCELKDVIPGGKLDEIIPDKETLARILSYDILK